MRSYIGIPLCLALGLAALTPSAAIVSQNPFNDRLMKLSLADRNGALVRAITLTGQKCGRLGDSNYRGLHGNLARWEVNCTPGGSYGVFLGPEGSAQVRPCADMSVLKLTACVKPD